MHWPNRTEYTQAVRDYPHISIKDPKLKGGKPQFAKDGFLNSFNGGFSIVFPFDMTSQIYALRCWTQEVGNAEFRYKEICAYLKQVSLPYFVDFEYVPDGILVNGTKYPITRMEWAKGQTLRDFIEQNIQDAHIFKNVASEFQKMVASLHKHQIAHGDLQDGNILLKRNGTDISIKLIDYDSLYVPTLKGQPDQIIGLKEYQHPKRMLGGGHANEKVDYFSELVIYLSFLSLAEKPSLWSQFGNEKRVNSGLLFSKEDFGNLNQSDIFQELKNLSPEIQQLTGTLKDYCAKTSIDQLQPLEAILPKPDANTHTNHGFSLLNDKRYDEALTEFQKAIVINPNYKKAGYGIGLAHLHSQRYSDAISAFGQAIGKDPNYKEAYYGLGLAHFKSGNNSKAMIAVNEALIIDPHYQLAKQLLDAIKNPPIPPDPPDPPNPPDPSPNYWQSLVSVLRTHWQFITPGILGVGLIICLIAFLTQMNAKGTVITQNTGLKDQLAQKETHIQGLNTSIQTLKSNNESLNTKNKTLQEELKSKTLSDEKTTQNVVSLQRQLNEQKDENRQLQNQLTKKDIEIRKLQTDESDALNQKSGLESQLGQKNLEINRLNTKLKNIQKENSELQREKFKLQTENKALTRLKESLNTDIVSLRRQLNDNKQNVSNNGVETNRPNIRPQENLVVLEPPAEIDAYKEVATLASTNYNNSGIKAFKRKDYKIAVAHFKQAVLADSNFAPSHYNLGCAYFSKEEYPKAIIAFSDAIKLNQRYKEAYYNRSLAYFRSRRLKEAKRDAEKAISINRYYKRARNLLERIQKSAK